MMRWFKHITLAAQDEKLSQLIDLCGLEGYGFFWRVLEIIAAQVDESDKNYCSYSKLAWCRMLAVNHQTWSKLIARSEQAGIFIVSEDEQGIRIESPNILKYRDEWTRKKGRNSGATPERLRSKEQIQIQNTDTEEDIRGRNGENAAAPAPVYKLPLAGKPGQEKEFPVTAELFADWESAYPLVNVREELKRIKAWLVSNPGKRPAKNMPRFVNTWLAKEQDVQAGKAARQSAARDGPSRPLTAAEERRRQIGQDATDVLKAREILRNDPDSPYGHGVNGPVHALPPAPAGERRPASAGLGLV